MSGSPNMHGWTHRPKSQGGTDPIPGNPSGAWCSLSRSTGVLVDSGTSYDTDAFPNWEATEIYGSEYFAAMTDGNGVEGIKILQPGTYAFNAFVSVREDNASNVIPPTVRLMIVVAVDGTDDFGTTAFAESLNGGWIAHNPAGTSYVPPSISPSGSLMVVGGSFVFSLTQDELTFSADSFTCRIASEGGTDNWRWYPVFLKIQHLGPVLDA